MKRLIIIGNGFDLHHGLKTSLASFKNYVSSNHPDIFEIFERLFINIPLNNNTPHSISENPSQQYWNQLESSLGLIDWNDFDEDSNDNTSEYNHDVGMTEILTNIYADNLIDITRIIRPWIEGIEIPSNTKITLPFNISDLFINFNYTETLELSESINKENILYIHGSRRGPSKLIFGHDNPPEPPKSKHDLIECESPYNRFLEETYKPVSKIIPTLINWLSEHEPIDKIIVLGHSMGKPDQCYFKAISEKYPNASWKSSFHTNADLRNISLMAKNLNLKIDLIKNIEFFN